MTNHSRTAVERYAADHFVTNGVTPSRQRTVLMCLRRFEEHAGKPPEECTDDDLRAFVTHEIREGLHINTVFLHLRSIKPFYTWAWRNRIVDAETFHRIRDIDPPRGSTNAAKPRPYKPHEIQRFYAWLDKRYPTSSELMVRRFANGQSRYQRVYRHGLHLQTEAIVSLALMAGMRSSEIRLADIEEIHPDNDYIVARGKSAFGERQGYREVPYTEHGREVMARWLEFRALCKPGHDRPWLKLDVHASPNGHFGPGSPLDPMDRFDGVLKAPWEMHRFRHTAATEWLRAGVTLERVSKLLGHASVTETMGYAELVREDLRDDLRRHERQFVGRVTRAA